MKVLVGAFNKEKALVGAFSVIVQLHRLIDLRHYQGAGVVGGRGGEPRPQPGPGHHARQEEDPVRGQDPEAESFPGEQRQASYNTGL